MKDEQANVCGHPLSRHRGIIDPLASDLGRIFGQDREARPYRLAADLLTGADPYGGDFLMAFRAGELA